MKFSPSTNQEHLALITKTLSNGLVLLKSDEEIVESLKTLPVDIDLNHVDSEFNTVLFLASANNYSKTVEYLLNVRKVDANIKVNENLTAAHIAAASGHLAVLKLLLSVSNIQLSGKDAYGETPLFRAIGNAPTFKLEETINMLLNKDATTVNIVNEDGIYPIELALQRNVVGVLKSLLDHGASVTQRCYLDAGNLMVAKSQPSRHFGGPMVFFTDSAQNASLRECAKLIINTYNSTHVGLEMKSPRVG